MNIRVTGGSEKAKYLKNQGFSALEAQSEANVSGPEGVPKTAVTPFPRPSTADRRTAALTAHLGTMRLPRGMARPWLLPAEQTVALLVDLPASGRRRWDALLPFAIEERLGQPVEQVAVIRAPQTDPAAGPDRVLALVASREVLAGARLQAGPDVGILPEFMVLPRPEANLDGPVWSVWRDGERAVVRVSDGTGFGVAIDVLPDLLGGGRQAGDAQPRGRPAVGDAGPGPVGGATPGRSARSGGRDADTAGPPRRPLGQDVARRGGGGGSGPCRTSGAGRAGPRRARSHRRHRARRSPGQHRRGPAGRHPWQRPDAGAGAAEPETGGPDRWPFPAPSRRRSRPLC